MAKKVAGFIKLQIPAGKSYPCTAGRPRYGPAWRKHHGLL